MEEIDRKGTKLQKRKALQTKPSSKTTCNSGERRPAASVRGLPESQIKREGVAEKALRGRRGKTKKKEGKI